MLRLKLTLARLARAMSRRLGRGGGTTLPGRLLLRLDRHAIRRLGQRLGAGTMLLSATNGKTTTASMIAGILERARRPVVRNAAGSNMHWGIATALIDAGRDSSELGLFEVDEAWLPAVARELQPDTFVLCNLFRDQLDRYGELELLADRWAELVDERAGSARFVLNADDPLVADLGRERPGVVYFGISDDSQALPELQHAADSKHCRNCGTPYDYEAVYLGHLGRYRCPGCGRQRPEPAVVAERITLDGMSGSQMSLRTPAGSTEIRLPLPGLYNVYNAVAAAAAAMELGAPLDDVKASLEAQTAAFGRVETIPVEGRDVSILLVKNPAGANEVLRTLTLEGRELDLWIALNDKIADGRDVSWVWDADFELLAGRVRRVTCSGTRAEEMALRLKYAGIDAELEVERDLWRALESAVGAVNGGGRLFALPTYTALLELRDLLAERGLARPWAG
jgi:UDP-N-acetylmuramyl tripeptide synthase